MRVTRTGPALRLASRGESCGTVGESDPDYRCRNVCTFIFSRHDGTQLGPRHFWPIGPRHVVVAGPRVNGQKCARGTLPPKDRK